MIKQLDKFKFIKERYNSTTNLFKSGSNISPFIILLLNLYPKIISCKEKYEPRLIKVRIFSVWCGKCRALEKRLIIVFSEKSETRVEDCPVSYPGKDLAIIKNKDQDFHPGLYLVREMSCVKKTLEKSF